MAKKPQKRFLHRPQKKTVQELLEYGTLDSMRAAKKLNDELLKYHWDYYFELARQRDEIIKEIKDALTLKSKSDYTFSKWQRAVKYKYGLHPLSTTGSINSVGGRFNIGKAINSQVPHFPALYIATDKDTALQEHLGQGSTNQTSKLTPRELALTNPSSETIVSISGRLDKIFDLTDVNNLEPFIALTKKFKLPNTLQQRAQLLNQTRLPEVIKTAKELLNHLLHPNWRLSPAQLDVPANSQIFGHLILLAGIDGILYPSKFTDKPCLAIFPQNFPNGTSFICMDDEPPHKETPTRIDTYNWRICELNFDELILKSNISH
jgi:hypothetical protein